MYQSNDILIFTYRGNEHIESENYIITDIKYDRVGLTNSKGIHCFIEKSRLDTSLSRNDGKFIIKPKTHLDESLFLI